MRSKVSATRRRIALAYTPAVLLLLSIHLCEELTSLVRSVRNMITKIPLSECKRTRSERRFTQARTRVICAQFYFARCLSLSKLMDA